MVSFESQRQQTYLRTCAVAQSLIRIFTKRILVSQGYKFSSCAQRRLIRLRRCEGWWESSLGVQARAWQKIRILTLWFINIALVLFLGESPLFLCVYIMLYVIQTLAEVREGCLPPLWPFPGILLFRSIVYKYPEYTYIKISFKIVVHVIIIDQWNQTARLYEIQVTVIYSCACHCDVRMSCKAGYLKNLDCDIG